MEIIFYGWEVGINKETRKIIAVAKCAGCLGEEVVSLRVSGRLK